MGGIARKEALVNLTAVSSKDAREPECGAKNTPIYGPDALGNGAINHDPLQLSRFAVCKPSLICCSSIWLF